MDCDYEYSDQRCIVCGHAPTHIRRCTHIGCEDGYIDESDEDLCVEGSVLVKCETCHGTGMERWCPKCGEDNYIPSLEEIAQEADA